MDNKSKNWPIFIILNKINQNNEKINEQDKNELTEKIMKLLLTHKYYDIFEDSCNSLFNLAAN